MQKTAYDLRISDWSSDVCSSDLQRADRLPTVNATGTATYTNNLASMGGGAGSSSSDIEVYQATVGLSAFELDLFGRVRNLSRAAQEQYFASEEAQRSARISLIAEIANAWLTMASDSEQLRLSRETAKIGRAHV